MLAHVTTQEVDGGPQTFTVDPPVGQRVALFFPFADVWVHQRVIEQFAHAWSQENQIHLIKCDGIRHGACPAHRALKLDDNTRLSDRRRVCARCQCVSGLGRNLNLIELNEFPLHDFTLPQTLEDLLEFTHNDHPFGHIAIYEYLLSSKKSHDDLTQEDRDPVECAIRDALEIYSKLLLLFRMRKFDTLVVNNQLYGLNAAAALAAQDQGIRVLNLHLGMFRSHLDRSVFLVSTSDSHLLLGQTYRKEDSTTAPLSANFESTLQKELRARYLQRHSLNYGSWPSRWKSGKAFEHRFSSTLFLSSPDEMKSHFFVVGKPEVDMDQLQLLTNFIQYAERNPLKQFCVRPHPRLERNTRDLSRSPFASILQGQLEDLPTNITVDAGPTIKPVIETIRNSDSIVVSWSSVGLDAAALGIPVVFGISGFPLSYPQEVGTPVVDNSYHALEKAMGDALRPQGGSKERSAIQFYYFLWNAHVRFPMQAVNYSPSLVLLWLDTKLGHRLNPRLHRVLRRIETMFNAVVCTRFSYLRSRLTSFELAHRRAGVSPPSGIGFETKISNNLRRALHIRQT